MTQVSQRGRVTIPGLFGDISGTVSVRAAGDNATSVTGLAVNARFGVARGD